MSIDKLKIRQNFIPPSTYKRPMLKQQVKFITIHSTGNPKSTAANERAWLTNPANKKQASWHYVIDQQEIIQAIPDLEVAYHAGDGQGNGNRASLGLELCESGNREKVLANGAKLAAQLLTKYGLSMDRLVQHNHWSGKDCPRILRNKALAQGRDWTYFKNLVAKELMVLVQKEVAVRLPNGKLLNLQGVELEGSNYVGIRAILEPLGYVVGYQQGVVTLSLSNNQT